MKSHTSMENSKQQPPPPSHANSVATSPVNTVSLFSPSNAIFQIDIQQVENGFVSDDPAVQIEAARKLRVMLSSERDILIRQVLERNWIPRLIKWLRLHDRPTLQVEALWALTNIAAGTTENTHILLKHGVIPTLVSLLDSSNDEVLEQSVWVLGNLAGEGSATRDAVLHAGALVALVKCLQRNSKVSLLRIGTWTLSNLCDGQPRPVFDITVVLPLLSRLLDSEDTEVLSHICWSLSHLCDGPSTHIQMVVNSEACWRLVELLMHRSWRVTKPALRAIGNIVCAEDDHDYTQHIIECGAVPCLRQLIAHSNREIQKESCWTLSNIAAGTVDQIQCVLDSGSIPPLIGLATGEMADPEVKSEACWVILNATSCGSDGQIGYLVKQGCISVLGGLLEETSMVMMALEGLERILQVGEQEAKRTVGSNPYSSLMASTKIETLESHKSAAVSKRASRIWREHFVTCAICSGAFSKHSPETVFCDECKCNVCSKCDCTVFHLQYQESLWKEETEKETSEKQAKQASKRSKRQKKRMRTKGRKAMLKQQKAEDDASEGKDFKDHDCDDATQLQIDSTDTNYAERKEECCSGIDGYYFQREERVGDSKSNNSVGLQSPIANLDGIARHDSPSLSPSLLKQSKGGNDLKASINSSNNAVKGKWMDKMMMANDNLVSYLEETGSILALAMRLDQEDDNVWMVEEEETNLIDSQSLSI